MSRALRRPFARQSVRRSEKRIGSGIRITCDARAQARGAEAEAPEPSVLDLAYGECWSIPAGLLGRGRQIAKWGVGNAIRLQTEIRRGVGFQALDEVLVPVAAIRWETPTTRLAQRLMRTFCFACE